MIDEIDKEPLEEETEIMQKPKKKKVLTEKQKEQGRANLAKGREALAAKHLKAKEETQKLTEELVIKKAEKIVKAKVNKESKIKATLGLDDNEPDEIEERIIKKPKKKRIIYKEESDSEEEVIIKPKRKELPTTVEQKQELPKQFRINFV